MYIYDSSILDMLGPVFAGVLLGIVAVGVNFSLHRIEEGNVLYIIFLYTVYYKIVPEASISESVIKYCNLDFMET